MTKDREIEALHSLIRRTNTDFIHRTAGERIKFLTLNNEQSKRKRKAKAKTYSSES